MEEEVQRSSQENYSANGSIWKKWYMIVIYVAIIGVLVFLVSTMDFYSNADVGPNDTLKSDQNDNSTNKSEERNYRETKKLFVDSLDPNETLEMNSSEFLPQKDFFKRGNWTSNLKDSPQITDGFIEGSVMEFSRNGAVWEYQFSQEIGGVYRAHAWRFNSTNSAKEDHYNLLKSGFISPGDWNISEYCFGSTIESARGKNNRNSPGEGVYWYNTTTGYCLRNNYVFAVRSKGVDENHYQNAEKLMNAMIGKFPY